jgi:hypothetical protein
MYFGTKSYLKSNRNHNHTAKHTKQRFGECGVNNVGERGINNIFLKLNFFLYVLDLFDTVI